MWNVFYCWLKMLIAHSLSNKYQPQREGKLCQSNPQPEIQYCLQYAACLTALQAKATACLQSANQTVPMKASNNSCGNCQAQLEQLVLQGNQLELQRLQEHISCIKRRNTNPPTNFNVQQAKACAANMSMFVPEQPSYAAQEYKRPAVDLNDECNQSKACCTTHPHCVYEYELSNTHDSIKAGRLAVLEKKYSCDLEKSQNKKG